MLQSGVAGLVGIVASVAPTICLICASGFDLGLCEQL